MAVPVRVLLLLLLAYAPASNAERFRVDVIVFRDQGSVGGESPLPAQAPDLARAVDPGETARLRAVGIDVLPDSAFGLTAEWQRLQNSRRHEPLLRLAWVQKDPPAEKGPALRLRAGSPHNVLDASGSPGVYPVDGSVSLLMGRYLHLDADLVFTTMTTVGDMGSYRLRERRRLRRGELHYLDSPKLGVLVRVLKADP